MKLLVATMFFRCPSQGGDLCSPEGRTCIEENSRRNFSCSANCEGVYLDIWKTQEDNVATDEHEIPETETESLPRWAQKIMANIQGKEDDANRNKISKLVREYNAYMKSKLQNFRFNPVKASSQFSKFFRGISHLFMFVLLQR